MRVLERGHLYELNCLDSVETEILRFVKRVGLNYPGNQSPPHPGTTVQEVLAAVVERLRYVNKQQPCLETEMSIGLAESIITLLEMRNARTKGRQLCLTSVAEVMLEEPCPQCNHIQCQEHF